MNLLSRRPRRFVFAATLSLLLLGALLPLKGGGYTRAASATVAYSGYGYEEEITYYSDPGLTNYVGTGHIYCNGGELLKEPVRHTIRKKFLILVAEAYPVKLQTIRLT